MDKRKYNLGDLSFSDALDLLQSEGYKMTRKEEYDDCDIVVIVVPTIEDAPNAKYYKDYGYMLFYFESECEASDELIGCLHCGGLYTCAAIFHGNDNITYSEAFCTPNTMLPLGSTLINDDSDDERSEREDANDDNDRCDDAKDEEQTAPHEAKNDNKNDKRSIDQNENVTISNKRSRTDTSSESQ